MTRLLKIVAIVLGSLVGLLVVVAIVVALVVDPNDYKDDITVAVKNATGRTLAIPGKLKLSFFPWIGLETGALELSNAPGFGKTPFARVKSADLKVAMLPLFKGQIEVGTVRLDGLEVNLAKAASGQTNWDDLMAARGEPPPAKKPDARQPAAPGAAAALAVGGVDIRDAKLTWHDQASGERLALRDFNLRTGRLAVGEPVQLHLDVELEQEKPARRIPVRLDTNLTATEKELALRKLDLRIDDSRVTGSVSLALDQPVYRFTLALDQIDADRYLPPEDPKQTTGAKAPPPKQPVAIPLSLLRALNTQGELKIGKLKAMGIRSEEVLVRVAAKGGVITLGPNAAKLYSGQYKGTTSIDVRGREPRFHFNESLTGIQVGPFLKDTQLFDRFSGTGTIALDLTAQGFDDRAIMSTLGGKVQIDFRKGQIVGVDLVKTISEAKAKFDQARGKSVRAKPARDAVTAYDALTASVTVDRGVATNSDLRMESPQLRATGKGSANLVSEQMDYRLKNRLTKDTKLSEVDVPIRVHGPFSDLAFEVEWGAIAKQVMEQKAEEKLKRKKEKLRERLLR